MIRAQLGLLLLASACTYAPKKTDADFFCGETAVSVAEGETLGGEVAVSVTLYNDDSEPADISLAWFEGDDPLALATVGGELTELSSSPDGDTHALVWDTVTDLGKGVFDGLTLRAVASSECGPWIEGLTEEITIDNDDLPEDLCDVEVVTPTGAQEGEVEVSFTLSHPQGASAYVSARYSVNAGEDWEPLSLADADCDGDGDSDRLTDLSTSPDGQRHCFTWDSQIDVDADGSAQIQLTCGVGYDEQDEAQTDAFELNNDTTPEANEILITEVMADPSAGDGGYLELYNATGKALDLNGLAVYRWTSTADPETDDPSKTYTITDPSGVRLLEPGAYFLLAESWSEADNGCLDPDVVWDSEFSLRGNSTLLLTIEATRPGSENVDIFRLDMLEDNGFEFDEGVSLGLDPSRLNASSANDVAWWCAAESEIPTCAATRETGLGTPGAENDPC